MRKYNKKEYLEYVKRLKEDGLEGCEIDYKTWKYAQPIADEASGITNKIIKKNILLKEDSKMKTKKGMKTLITKWAKKTSKRAGMDCLFDFEDKDERSFYFKYDGFLWDCLYYSGEFYRNNIAEFDMIFDKTGWSYEYEDASVIIVYKED